MMILKPGVRGKFVSFGHLGSPVSLGKGDSGSDTLRPQLLVPVLRFGLYPEPTAPSVTHRFHQDVWPPNRSCGPVETESGAELLWD